MSPDCEDGARKPDLCTTLSPRLAIMQHNTPEQVGAAVGAAMERLAQSVAPIVGPRLDLLEPLTVLASKGKRMRSSLLMMSHAAAGGGRDEVALRVAAALELFQVAALVHDDILDDSDTRRGLPSTHRVIEGLHLASGWRGDSGRFGTGGAILAGDLALMACMGELVAALTGVDGGRRRRCWRTVHRDGDGLHGRSIPRFEARGASV